MMVRVESPGVVSTCSTTTAGGISTGSCGFGRLGRGWVLTCACIAGASAASVKAPTRRIRFMSDSIYVFLRSYTSGFFAIQSGDSKTAEALTAPLLYLIGLLVI